MELLGAIRTVSYAIVIPSIILFAFVWKGDNKAVPWFLYAQAAVYMMQLYGLAVFGVKIPPRGLWEVCYTFFLMAEVIVCLAMLYREEKRRKRIPYTLRFPTFYRGEDDERGSEAGGRIR